MTPPPKKRGLGRGLDALLSGQNLDSAAPDRTSVLSVDLLQAGKYQPRTRMDRGVACRTGGIHQGRRA
jgi:ParB family chromosome partitioning protein